MLIFVSTLRAISLGLEFGAGFDTTDTHRGAPILSSKQRREERLGLNGRYFRVCWYFWKARWANNNRTTNATVGRDLCIALHTGVFISIQLQHSRLLFRPPANTQMIWNQYLNNRNTSIILSNCRIYFWWSGFNPDHLSKAYPSWLLTKLFNAPPIRPLIALPIFQHICRSKSTAFPTIEREGSHVSQCFRLPPRNAHPFELQVFSANGEPVLLLADIATRFVG